MKKLCMLMILALASSLASAAPTLTLVVDQVQLAPSPTAQQFTLNLTLTSDETFTALGYSINLSLEPVVPAGELKLISATSPAGLTFTNPTAGSSITNVLGAVHLAFAGTTTITANTPTVFLSYTIELKGNPQLAKYDLFKNPSAAVANNIGVVGESQSVPVTITPGYIAVPEPAMAGVVAVLGWMLGRRRRAA